MFDDQPDSWPTAYDNSDCNCMCQLAAAKDYYMLAVTGTNPGGEEIVEHLRPRFWYAALISCGDPITADYKVTFEQADGSQVGDGCGCGVDFLIAVLPRVAVAP